MEVAMLIGFCIGILQFCALLAVTFVLMHIIIIIEYSIFFKHRKTYSTAYAFKNIALILSFLTSTLLVFDFLNIINFDKILFPKDMSP